MKGKPAIAVHRRRAGKIVVRRPGRDPGRQVQAGRRRPRRDLRGAGFEVEVDRAAGRLALPGRHGRRHRPERPHHQGRRRRSSRSATASGAAGRRDPGPAATGAAATATATPPAVRRPATRRLATTSRRDLAAARSIAWPPGGAARVSSAPAGGVPPRRPGRPRPGRPPRPGPPSWPGPSAPSPVKPPAASAPAHELGAAPRRRAAPAGSASSTSLLGALLRGLLGAARRRRTRSAASRRFFASLVSTREHLVVGQLTRLPCRRPRRSARRRAPSAAWTWSARRGPSCAARMSAVEAVLQRAHGRPNVPCDRHAQRARYSALAAGAGRGRRGRRSRTPRWSSATCSRCAGSTCRCSRPDAEPLRVLHLSDLHLTPGPAAQAAVGGRRSPALDPDLVVVTGDNMAHPDAVPGVLRAPTSRCSTCPAPSSSAPTTTAARSGRTRSATSTRDREYVQGVDAAGRGAARRSSSAPAGPTSTTPAPTLKAGGRIDRAGRRRRPARRPRRLRRWWPARPRPAADLHIGAHPLAGAARPGRDGRRRLRPAAGRPHPRRPGLRARRRRAGHQLRPATARMARGLHRWPGTDSWLHVSAGLGTHPTAPVRFACRPEASLLTLIPR